MKKVKQSAALDVMDLVWNNSSRNSWITLNQNLHTVLGSLIEMDFVFGENDYEEICKRYRGHYWLYVSSNGNHQGEGLYATGTRSYNNSFVSSYEKHTQRLPYLLGSKRLYEGAEFFYNKLYWRVTGWSKDNQSINLVGYKNRVAEGKRTIMKVDREKWLIMRKDIKELL